MLSQERYSVHPIINACYVAALVHRYPTDELTLAQQDRQRKQREPGGRPSSGPAVVPPTVPGPPAGRRSGATGL
ncbi:MAG: hypothetical protein WCF99_15870 [Chloroflexales bacterium]